MIEITEVRVSLRTDDKLKAFVSITLNDSFVIRGLKVIKGNSGLFVAMPSRKRPDGQHQDLAHPINDPTRKYLTEKVMAEYQRELTHPTVIAAGPSVEEQHAYLRGAGCPAPPNAEVVKGASRAPVRALAG